MSLSYNSIEPNVIDDEMLQKAIEEQRPEDIVKLAESEGIDFRDVTELQLSFRNILQIDNLWQFESLTKLQLDNNVIEKIEALESLVHLVWLDLSFNNIEVIEGLDTLVKLQDLSLYNNRISKIEHMDTLQELQIFSIGKNNLTALEDVVYLRRFKKLRTLNLTGNPFCEEEQYVLFVVAHIPDLVYLDFKLVSDTTRELAVSKYQYLIDPLELEEAQALAQLEEKLAKQKELEYHKRLDEIHHATSYNIAESKRVEYNEDILQLSETLMTLEMQTVDQLEELIKDFEKNIAAIASTFMENVKGMMAQCRDLENRHHEKLLEISINTLEKSIKNELDEDLPDDIRGLLGDKTTLVNTVNTSHNVHLLKIDMRECDILSNTYRWQASVTGKAFQNEIDRNRSRVKEIFQYIDNLQEQLDNNLQEQLENIELLEPPE
ncbi:dynein regulatory complex subunit 3 isoform X2 [Oxyura jamaicensis]|uniref:dynein regulatory complex subunit 3 isoform X2 n=1 Tax=Oxyura jamaicensis TaxID=8884 RepID=UPI0015A69F89|nr:dynein regulatory complex subunit 3 isoform X2 [Oxyura jamaicensis]